MMQPGAVDTLEQLIGELSALRFVSLLQLCAIILIHDVFLPVMELRLTVVA